MNKKINILLLEDLPSDARLIQHALLRGKIDFNWQVVESKEKYIQGLQHFNPDIILSDHSLPCFSSKEALVILQESGKKIPFLLVTAAMSDVAAVDLIKMGVDDYIIKDRLHKLPTAVLNCLDKYRLQRERQASIDEVIRNEQHFRGLIEHIRDAILLVDVHAQIIYQSTSASRVTGFSFNDVKNEHLFTYIHPEDLQQYSLLFEDVRAQAGMPLSAIVRMKHKNGDYIWTEGTITNLLNDDCINAFVITYRDITERKKAEAKISSSRVYAEAIVSTIREPLIIINKEMVVRSANLSFYKKFQTTKELTEGKLLFNLGNKQWNKPELRELLSHILPGKTSIQNYEMVYNFTVGGKRILLLNATAINHDNLDQPSILLAVDDITEYREMEIKKKDFSRNLEKEVFERTFLLHEANTALQHSNKKLEQFAFVASHDLQEPLRKIRTYTSCLDDGYKGMLPEDAKNLISKVSHSAERMSTLIEQLLNYSTITSENSLFETAGLNDIVSHVKARFNEVLNEKKAVIAWQDLPLIEMIPVQIKQLFNNLISNSLKFTKEERPVVILITSKMLKAKELKQHTELNQKLSYIDIHFKDNGIGFEQEFAEKMFLIFHRLNGPEKFPGTGIGLALCKAIVINHHGEIYATSNKKTGTIFHIILPLVQQVSSPDIWETTSTKEHTIQLARRGISS